MDRSDEAVFESYNLGRHPAPAEETSLAMVVPTGGLHPANSAGNLLHFDQEAAMPILNPDSILSAQIPPLTSTVCLPFHSDVRPPFVGTTNAQHGPTQPHSSMAAAHRTAKRRAPNEFGDAQMHEFVATLPSNPLPGSSRMQHCVPSAYECAPPPTNPTFRPSGHSQEGHLRHRHSLTGECFNMSGRPATLLVDPPTQAPKVRRLAECPQADAFLAPFGSRAPLAPPNTTTAVHQGLPVPYIPARVQPPFHPQLACQPTIPGPSPPYLLPERQYSLMQNCVQSALHLCNPSNPALAFPRDLTPSAPIPSPVMPTSLTHSTCACPTLHQQHHLHQCRLHHIPCLQPSLLAINQSQPQRTTTHPAQPMVGMVGYVPFVSTLEPPLAQTLRPTTNATPIHAIPQQGIAANRHSSMRSGQPHDAWVNRSGIMNTGVESHHPPHHPTNTASSTALQFLHSAVLVNRLRQQEEERLRSLQFYQQPAATPSDSNMEAIRSLGQLVRITPSAVVLPAVTVVPPSSIELLIYPRASAEVATAAHIVLNGAAGGVDLNNDTAIGFHRVAAVAAATGAAIVEPQPVGLTPDRIERISSRINYMKEEDLKDGRERCTVCLVDFEKAEELRALQCSHFFHVDCIDRWLVYNKKCPICRVDADRRSKSLSTFAGSSSSSF